MSQSGKPPPVNGKTAAATPQKQFIVKITDGSPNYMKSTTSSSEARKERSQANTQTGSNGRNQHCRNSGRSKFSPASGDRPARTLSKTSGLKLARTPTFKPARGAAKKRSRAALLCRCGRERQSRRSAHTPTALSMVIITNLCLS
ncbi:hypothetical protein OIU76_003414 [Salix suchowensis]|nr:hypothetical protein OIU76_003414 [Salix suchowensis]